MSIAETGKMPETKIPTERLEELRQIAGRVNASCGAKIDDDISLGALYTGTRLATEKHL